ncbi:MAG: bifunctional oligoribonuclease/PAP phosphatase NrnA [Halobacteriovoraceae bacterium]|jgi:bifunctional oligoribonuclease and PAP phosphatase NrnA|nr:bifunctional oligoribonuclease/PAP phosphatase NrnA [Halobacteriovoraceae bacterium]
MNIITKFQKAITNAQSIVISTHSYPDADGIGSEISLCLALRKLGKKTLCVNNVELLERYKYLDTQSVVIGVERFKQDFFFEPDLIIIVDTNIIDRTGKHFRALHQELQCPILYIDHHPCNEARMLDHCINTKAAATGEVVGELILNSGLEFDEQTALPLYTAILIDTSSFRYPTVTAKTHELIAKLMATGIKPPSAYNGIYGTKKIQHMHLLGKVLSSANCSKNEEIAWIVLKEDELKEFNTDIEDTHGFINNLLILDNVKVACMFRDDGDKVKVSLRSSGEYDVGNIAVSIGGGGHSHSAASLIDKTVGNNLTEIIDQVIKNIEERLLPPK